MSTQAVQRAIAILLIATFTLMDFIGVGVNVVVAISEDLQLQTSETSNDNVEFNVYLKNEQESAYEQALKISEENQLYIFVKVKDKGVLNDVKIQLENANFKILEDKVNSEYVKEIKGQEISLNEIVYGKTVEIQIPIQFEKQSQIDSSYFDRETVFNFSAKYKDVKQEEVSTSKRLRILWNEEAEVNVDAKIEKYIPIDQDKFLLQEQLAVSVQDNVLPMQKEDIQIVVPAIENIKPEEVTVLLNGQKMQNGIDYKYDKELGTLQITNNNDVNDQNKIEWGNGENIYKIIYLYAGELKVDTTIIELNEKVLVKLYTKDEILKEKNEQVQISKQGEIVSQNIQTTEAVYKGYLYAGVNDETLYEQKNEIEISNADVITSIEIDTGLEKYTYLKNDNKQTKVEFSTNNCIYYKEIILSKENVNAILGSEGALTIKNQNDEIIEQILATNEANEDGNFVINFEESIVNRVKIIITKPAQEGNLTILYKKAISGDTGYTKTQLKQFQYLEGDSILTTNLQENIAHSNMNLLDTVTEATLTSSNVNLSTLQENENVEIIATLNSNNAKYDLYKNPYIEIQLPEEVENIEINSISQLFMEEFEVQSAEFIAEENKIKLKFIGEQKEFKNDVNQGARIVVNANITVNKDTVSKQSAIKMIYTNENGQQTSYETEQVINFVSQYGVLVYTDLDNYNDLGESTVVLTNQTADIKLDMGMEQKIANADMAIVNNYEQPIQDVSIIGEITQEKESTTFLTNLNDKLATNLPDATVLYSYESGMDENSDKWLQDVEDFSRVRAYKIVLSDKTLESKQVLKISYQLEIPENLEANQVTNNTLKVSYLYDGQKVESDTIVSLSTPVVSVQAGNDDIQDGQEGESDSITEEKDEIEASVSVTSAGKLIQNGEEVFEGQTLKYTVKVTNNTEEDLNNLKLIATHTNAIFFGEVEKEVINTFEEQESTELFYEEDPLLEQKELVVENLPKGETHVFEYEFSVSKEDELNQTSGNLNISVDGQEKALISAYTNPIKDAQLKIVMNYTGTITRKYTTSEVFRVSAKLYNFTENVQDAEFEMELPEYINFNTDFELQEDFEFVSCENNVLKLKIPNIQAESKKEIILYFSFDEEKIPEDLEEVVVPLMAEVISKDEQVYTSNIATKTFYVDEPDVEIVQTANIEGNTVKNGDKIIYTNIITNPSTEQRNINIKYFIPNGLDIEKIYIIKDGIEQDVNNVEEDFAQTSIDLEPEESIQYVIEAKVNTERTIIGQTEIENVISISSVYGDVESNAIIYEIIYEQDEDNDTSDDSNDNDNNDDNNSDDENNNDNEDNDDSNVPEVKKYQVSGKVWVDKNKNGLREETETLLNNIKVFLLDAKTGEAIKDTSGNVIQYTTNERGEYIFTNVEKGEYIIAFEYDNTKYRITEYQKQGVSDRLNSDVINNGNSQAITDILQITNDSIDNIDMGLIENEKFDFSLDKTIKRITVRDSSSVQVSEYGNAHLTKIEIDSKKLSGSIVLIEYQILVKNEGELAGYVNEVVDYIPNDLEFSSEMNKDWYISTDGNLHNISLTNELIKPGETKVITLTLVKTMSVNNTGTIVNMAEIAKTSNELSFKDSDSTEGNRIQSEDDMGRAEVIVSVKTGLAITISISIIFVILIGTCVVIYIIKRKEEKNV